MYGAPTSPVTMPVESGVGARCCAMRSAMSTMSVPTSAAATVRPPEEPSSRPAIGPAISATNAIGPAAAVASATSTTATQDAELGGLHPNAEGCRRVGSELDDAQSPPEQRRRGQEHDNGDGEGHEVGLARQADRPDEPAGRARASATVARESRNPVIDSRKAPTPMPTRMKRYPTTPPRQASARMTAAAASAPPMAAADRA